MERRVDGLSFNSIMDWDKEPGGPCLPHLLPGQASAWKKRRNVAQTGATDHEGQNVIYQFQPSTRNSVMSVLNMLMESSTEKMIEKDMSILSKTC